MITVHEMGAHYRWAPPEVLRQQLRLAHDLREDLVTLQLQYDEDLKAIWSSYPQVTAAETALVDAQAEATAAAEAVKHARIAARSKNVDRHLTERLRQTTAALKAARQARRDAINTVHGDEVSARRRERAAQLIAAHKALYARYCQHGGQLYWATFNRILDRHKIAVKNIAAQRAAGRPGTLRHHRFDGSGLVAVQLQRETGSPARTPAVIADPAGKYRNVLHIPGWTSPDRWDAMTRAEQRRAGRVTVRMRCGSMDGQPKWIEIPVQAHRWLPDQADIIGAELVVTRTGGTFAAKLCITARIDDPDPITAGPTVAVHLGWLSAEQGTVVASWRSDQPLDIPAALHAVMTSDHDRMTGKVIVPASIEQRLRRAEETASARALTMEALRHKVATWLDEHGPGDYRGEPLDAAAVRMWRSPARFAALAQAWRDQPTEIAATLWDWYRQDLKSWNRQERGRRKALGHRDDLYRQVAATLSAQAGTVVVDNTNISAIRRHDDEPIDLPLPVQTQIDRRRDHAAPAGLRAAVTAAATRDGVPVVVVPAGDLSRTHARCGYTNPADDRYAAHPVLCDGCGAAYDQDASATVMMLRAAGTDITA